MKSVFHHEEIYRGKDFVNKISKKRITICGVGAIGSNLLDNLIRQGYSNIKIIDMDRVEDHNIGTQIYNRSHIGSLKVQSCKNIVFQTTGVEIEIENKELTRNNVKKLLKDSDLVVDCFDNSESRKIITDFCLDNKLPCLHNGLAGEGYGEVIWNESYKVPSNPTKDEIPPCDQPIARNLILLTIICACEEINNFIDSKPKRNHSITLKDLKISTQKGV